MQLYEIDLIKIRILRDNLHMQMRFQVKEDSTWELEQLKTLDIWLQLS